MQTASMDGEGAADDYGFGPNRARMSVTAAIVAPLAAIGGHGHRAHRPGQGHRRREIPDRVSMTEGRHGGA